MELYGWTDAADGQSKQVTLPFLTARASTQHTHARTYIHAHKQAVTHLPTYPLTHACTHAYVTHVLVEQCDSDGCVEGGECAICIEPYNETRRMCAFPCGCVISFLFRYPDIWPLSQPPSSPPPPVFPLTNIPIATRALSCLALPCHFRRHAMCVTCAVRTLEQFVARSSEGRRRLRRKAVDPQGRCPFCREDVTLSSIYLPDLASDSLLKL